MARSGQQQQALALSGDPRGSYRAAGGGARRGAGDSDLHLGDRGCYIRGRNGKLNASWI